MSDDQHESPIKTPRQLITIVVLAFVIPIALIILVAQLVTGGEKGLKDSDTAVLERIMPVGQVVIAAPSGPKGQLTGEQVFGQVCKNCHEAGVAGAPKFGDKAAWAKVIAQGSPTTVEHAIKGIRAMPAKGGNPDLDDVEVERAVVYMANKGGANWKDPPAPSASATERTGEQVVAATCGKCHQTGENGAPKNRRPRGVDEPGQERLPDGRAIGAEGARRHAGARRHGRSLRRRESSAPSST